MATASSQDVEVAGVAEGRTFTDEKATRSCRPRGILATSALVIALLGVGIGIGILISQLFMPVTGSDDDDAMTPTSKMTQTTPYPGMLAATPMEDFVDVPTLEEYEDALDKLDLDAVKADVTELLTSSKYWWPADDGNYGPFFVRLAWHCSGSFRKTDGAGGCAGGRQRFEPEASWEDNTNLDKARALLAPIKAKYGMGLSWGDLFVLAGTTALRSMGAPITTFCAGRIDDPNGSKSLPLGPSEIQKEEAPCVGDKNGLCQDPANETNLASTTVGLIYVNPEGVLGVPEPANSVDEIRTTFQKMGHDDRATVALIGGGHAFGKAHGACEVTDAAGLPPNTAYASSPMQCPWSGRCGTGNGNDTWTSGFEGAWTSTPTKWSNEFFQYLVDKEWEKHVGPGGHWQWRLKDSPDDPRIRFTTDLALLYDESYKAIAQEFASNMTALDEAFDSAWTVLTTNGNGWLSKSKQKCDEFSLPSTSERRLSAGMLNSDMELASTEPVN